MPTYQTQTSSYLLATTRDQTSRANIPTDQTQTSSYYLATTRNQTSHATLWTQQQQTSQAELAYVQYQTSQAQISGQQQQTSQALIAGIAHQTSRAQIHTAAIQTSRYQLSAGPVQGGTFEMRLSQTVTVSWHLARSRRQVDNTFPADRIYRMGRPARTMHLTSTMMYKADADALEAVIATAAQNGTVMPFRLSTGLLLSGIPTIIHRENLRGMKTSTLAIDVWVG